MKISGEQHFLLMTTPHRYRFKCFLDQNLRFSYVFREIRIELIRLSWRDFPTRFADIVLSSFPVSCENNKVLKAFC